MKLTKSKLKQIIKEELNKERILKEDNLLMENIEQLPNMQGLIKAMTSGSNVRQTQFNALKGPYKEALEQVVIGLEATMEVYEKDGKDAGRHEQLLNQVMAAIRQLGG